MSEHPNPAAETLAGLESALRDAAARAMKPAMPLMLALGFFQAVIALSGCMRQCRKLAGLPGEWPAELIGLLRSVVAAANARRTDPSLTEAQALRLVRAVTGLIRSELRAMPAPPKPSKTPSKPVPQQAPASLPSAPTPRWRRDEYEGVGGIAIRVRRADLSPESMMADAVRQAMGRPPAS